MRTYTSYYGLASTTPAYSTGDIARIINNTQTDNLDWGIEQVNDAIRNLVTKYYFNERSYTTSTVAQQQFYNLPPQVKNLINLTVTIGSVVYTPMPCPTRDMWDRLNVTTFYQDFPSYFFVYNGQVGLFPNPASSGNVITMNYKTRIVDLVMPDVSSGTVTVTSGTVTVSNTSSVFANWMEDNWLRVPYSPTNASSGDNQWYQIDTVDSGTLIRLKNNYTGATASSGTYTIGQVSILPEDYQDLPLYRMGIVYYTTRFPDPTKAQLYQGLWDRGIEALNSEYGAKTTNVALADTNVQILNPNLYQSNLS